MLSGHTSFETAYRVENYPYGRLRCKIWFWIEHKASKGYRFMSRTENPKNGRMNAPKASTYMEFAGAMYLDENEHVQWAGLHAYSSPEVILTFVKNFPEYSERTFLLGIVKAKERLVEKFLSGESFFTINGKKQELSITDKELRNAEIATYRQIISLLR